MKKKYKKLTGICLLLTFLIIFSGNGILAQKNPKDKFDFPKLNPIKMPDIEKVELSNGLQLFLVEESKYPTIDLRAMIHTGSVFEPEDKIGLASITGQVLRTGGTETRTGDEIDKELETMAASISTGIGQTSGYIMTSALKEDIDKVMEILADIIINPVFSEEKIQLAKIKKGVENVTKEDILKVAKKYLHSDKVQILVVGNKDKLDKPLSSLGEVNEIDISIPKPKSNNRK
ncbi:MAG: M16 family metallopeptidase [Candidatus Aminicenantaceae bacterium]